MNFFFTGELHDMTLMRLQKTHQFFKKHKKILPIHTLGVGINDKDNNNYMTLNYAIVKIILGYRIRQEVASL